jgi:hypothetical protein
VGRITVGEAIMMSLSWLRVTEAVGNRNGDGATVAQPASPGRRRGVSRGPSIAPFSGVGRFDSQDAARGFGSQAAVSRNQGSGIRDERDKDRLVFAFVALTPDP